MIDGTLTALLVVLSNFTGTMLHPKTQRMMESRTGYLRDMVVLAAIYLDNNKEEDHLHKTITIFILFKIISMLPPKPFLFVVAAFTGSAFINRHK